MPLEKDRLLGLGRWHFLFIGTRAHLSMMDQVSTGIRVNSLAQWLHVRITTSMALYHPHFQSSCAYVGTAWEGESCERMDTCSNFFRTRNCSDQYGDVGLCVRRVSGWIEYNAKIPSVLHGWCKHTGVSISGQCIVLKNSYQVTRNLNHLIPSS